ALYKSFAGVSFTVDLSEFRQIYIEIQIFVGNVMIGNAIELREKPAEFPGKNSDFTLSVITNVNPF
ncbi:hypothetical protein IQ66_14865, partial [Leptospira borgpetersenii serovar Ballum]